MLPLTRYYLTCHKIGSVMLPGTTSPRFVSSLLSATYEKTFCGDPFHPFDFFLSSISSLILTKIVQNSSFSFTHNSLMISFIVLLRTESIFNSSDSKISRRALNISDEACTEVAIVVLGARNQLIDRERLKF